MNGALVWLLARTSRNWIGRRLRQLRDPRYALTLVVGAVYLWFSLLGHGDAPVALPVHREWLELALAFGLLLIAAWAWVWGQARRTLAFSAAEVAFLFPAPIPRRALVQYKLLRAQSLILVNTLLWTVLLAGRGGEIASWRRAVAVWVTLSTIYVHRLGASFVRASVLQHGRAGLRRRSASLVAVLVVVLVIAWSVAGALPELRSAWSDGLTALGGAVESLAAQPAMRVVLWPFRTLVRPILTVSAAEWLGAILPAAALLALHCAWVLRADSAFEEAAAEVTATRARRLAARGQGLAPEEPGARLSPALFTLAPTGRPEVAIFWKNLAALLRRRRLTRNATAFVVVASALAVLGARGAPVLAQMGGTLAGVWVAMLIVVGPQWVRNDLRIDLRALELLRSYPLSGGAIVRSEVAASAVVLTLLQLGLLLVAFAGFAADASLPLAAGERLVLLVSAPIVLPAVNLTVLLVTNGAALLFPAWSQLGPNRAGGVETLGQTMLLTVACWVVALALLAGPALLAAGALSVLAGSVGAWALVPALGLALAGVSAEALMVSGWLGRVLERLEPASLPP